MPKYTTAKLFSAAGKKNNQANGKRSHGPATPEGRERIRAANIRHGFYSKAEAVALACLGEDPADLERLRKNLHEGWQLPSALQEELAEHLTQVVWRWNRASADVEDGRIQLSPNLADHQPASED